MVTLPALCPLVALGVNTLRESILQARVDGRESHWLLMNFTTWVPILGQKVKPHIIKAAKAQSRKNIIFTYYILSVQLY